MDCFDEGTFEDVRIKAMVAFFLATDRRLNDILQMEISDLKTTSGEFWVTAKWGKRLAVVLLDKAVRIVRAYTYLRVRPKNEQTTRLWLTEKGDLLTYNGGQSMFRRLKKRSGISTLYCHVFRHNFAKVAVEKGVDRADLQEMMGHESDYMPRLYEGAVCHRTAARKMPQFSPL